MTDCVVVIDRKGAEAQLIGNAIFAMGVALWQSIAIENAAVQNRSYSDFRVALMRDVPPVEAILLPSEREPSGLGEPANPVVTAAIANAWSRVTGKRVRALPVGRSDG